MLTTIITAELDGIWKERIRHQIADGRIWIHFPKYIGPTIMLVINVHVNEEPNIKIVFFRIETTTQ